MCSVRYKGHRIAISDEAEFGNCVEEAASTDPERADDKSSKIYGLVRVEEVEIYDAMMVVEPEVHHQLDFWRRITGRSLHGECFLFRCDDVRDLPQPADVQQFGQKRFRSFLTELEPEQGPRLWKRLNNAEHNSAPIADCPCHVMLRAPRPFVEQLMYGKWSTLLLPHLPNASKAGSATLTINWPAIGLKPSSPSIPRLSAIALNFPDSEQNIALTTELVDEAVNFLKKHAASFPVSCDDEIFDNVEYASLQRCVAIFQNLRAGMDPSAFVRSVRDMTGKGHASWLSSRRPYQVAFLVKAVTMASLLRSSDAMSETLQVAASIVLPATLQPAFMSMLQTCENHVPHESTISRWKLILDGSFMLYLRKQALLRDSDGCVRYLMADSSTQHGRELEHIMLCSIRKQDLGRLYMNYCRLMDLWPLSRC